MNLRPFLNRCLIAFVCLLVAREAAAFTTNDQVAIRQAVVAARGWLGLPRAMDDKFVIEAVMGYHKPQLVTDYQIKSDELKIRISAKDGRLVQAVNLALQGELNDRSKVPTNLPSRLSRPEAVRMALAAAERMGVNVDDNFRPWERFGSAPPNNYDAKQQEWRFDWSRHIADVPVSNEGLSVCIDDQSGKVSSLRNGVRSSYTPAQVVPKVRIADARDKALDVAKRLWAKDSGQHAQLWEAYRVVGGNPLCYYLQEELDPAKLRLNPQPGPGLKLRLVFIILIGKNLPDPSIKSGKWFATEHRVMIDAVTGEYVPFNE